MSALSRLALTPAGLKSCALSSEGRALLQRELNKLRPLLAQQRATLDAQDKRLIANIEAALGQVQL